MNSRQQRRFRSYGRSNSEIIESQKKFKEEFKENCKRVIKEAGIDPKYHPVDEKHRTIINRAKSMYLVGKHAGSKTIKSLLQKIKARERQISKYIKTLKAVEALKESKETVAENVD